MALRLPPEDRAMKEWAAAINAIATRHGGRITPEQVVAEAQNPDSPLHGYFEWRDDEAAHKYRIEQARGLIRSVHVKIQVETKYVKTVAYVRDPALPNAESGYISVAKIRSETEIARDVLIAEFARVGAVLARAKSLAQVLGIAQDVAVIAHQVDELNRKVLAVTPTSLMATA